MIRRGRGSSVETITKRFLVRVRRLKRAPWVDHVLAGVLFFCWVLALFPTCLGKDQVLYLLDISIQNYPFQDYAFNKLAQGLLPLWCRELNCGFPLFAEGQAGTLYLPNIWFHALFSALTAITASVLFHIWSAAVAMYWYLLTRKHAYYTAVVMALAWSGSTYMTQHYFLTPYLSTVVWIPLGLTLIDLGWSANRRWLALLSALVGFQALAGHAPGLFVALSAYILHVLTDLVIRSKSSNYQRLRYGATVLLALGVGLGLAAVQLVPTMELAKRSVRSGGLPYTIMTQMSLPPRMLLSLVAPGFFGSPADDSAWAVSDGYPWEFALYPGLLIVGLAIVGLRPLHDRRTLPSLVITAVGLLLMLGSFTPAYRLLQLVPGASFFRIPARWSLIFLLGLISLAASGLDRVLHESASIRFRKLLFIIPATILLAIVFALNAWFLGTEVRFSEPFFLSARFLRIEAAFLLSCFRSALLLIALLVVLPSRGATRLWRKLLIAFLVVSDLATLAWDYTDTMSERVLTAKPATLNAMVNNLLNGRVLSLVTEQNSPYNWHKGWICDRNSYAKLPETIMMYRPLVDGLEGIALHGWSPLHPSALSELYATISPEVLDMLNVTLLVAPKSHRPPGMEALVEDDLGVYRRVSRAGYISSNWGVIDSKDLGRVMNRAGLLANFHKRILVPTAPAPLHDKWLTSSRSKGTVEVLGHDDNSLGLAILCEQAGAFFLSQLFDPGWRWESAEQGGIQAIEVNLALTALLLPAGAYHLTARYEPWSFRVGLFITLVSGAFLIGSSCVIRPSASRMVALSSGAISAAQVRSIMWVLGFLVGVSVLMGVVSGGWVESLAQISLQKCYDYRALLTFL